MEHPELPKLRPFVLCAPSALRALPRQVWGLEVVPLSACAPELVAFRQALMRLDGLTFGPEGMPMADWLFEDTAFLPGLVAGWAIEPSQLSQAQRELLRMPAECELWPLSMYIAIPDGAGGLFGHNLASLAGLLPELKLRRLGTLTKTLGLALAQSTRVSGITQWDSHALGLHAKFGPLTLESAWTPLHSFPASLVYRVSLAPEALSALWQGGIICRPRPNAWVSTSDHQALQRLQQELEEGVEIAVLAGPTDGQVPLYRGPLSPSP